MLLPVRRNVVTAWVGVLAVTGAAALSGVSITLANSALWFAVCVVPPVVILMVWRGAPPAMEEILFTEGQAARSRIIQRLRDSVHSRPTGLAPRT
jgi:hypothetical protein